MSAWQEDATSPGTVALQTYIASHLGWDDLHADTKVAERTFDIRYFFDPTSS